MTDNHAWGRASPTSYDPDGRPLVRSNDGILWVNRPGTDDRLAFEGHEMSLWPIVAKHCPEGSLFVDVGAHVGTWALRMGGAGRDVVAIEANPYTFSALAANMFANRSDRVVPFLMAAWDDFDYLSISDANGMDSGGSSRVTSTGTLAKGMIHCVPLDAIRAPYRGRNTLIKIDVEGEEARVLRGATEWIHEDKPTLFIELHSRVYGDSQMDENVITELAKLHYVASDRILYGGCDYVLAWHESRAPEAKP